MDYFNITLKFLYGLDTTQFNNLRAKLNQNRLEHYNKGTIVNYLIQNKNNINQLIQKQSSIKDKIPYMKLNMVNNYLIDITGDIHNFEEKIKINKEENNVKNKYNFSYKTSSVLDFNLDTLIRENNPINNHSNSNPINNHSNSNSNNHSNSNSNNHSNSNPNNHSNSNSNNHSNSNSNNHSNSNSNNHSNSKIDPYKIFGLDINKPLNLDEIKNKYRTYALQTHPDKNKGDTTNFIIIQDCFKKLVEDYKLKQNDKQYNQLKNESVSFIESQSKQNLNNTQIDKNSFNINKFNKVFHDNRLDNKKDSGYADWIKANNFDSEDIQKDNSLTTGNFNNRFNKTVKVSNHVIHYQKPNEMFMNRDNNCEELGQKKIDNYSGKSKHISYTDYKEAHTTGRLVDPTTKYNEFKDLNHIKHSRENIKEQSNEELQQIAIENEKKDNLEQERIRHQQYIDNIYSKKYDEVHNIMLN